MAIITFEGRSYPAREGESVLDALLRQGASVDSSCRGGVCQTCILQAVSGQLDPRSQQSLKQSLKDQRYFLPCVCAPTGDMEVARPGEAVVSRLKASVIEKEPLNGDIVRLRIRCQGGLACRAGQFIHLRRGDGLVRSYSIAGMRAVESDSLIDLHVRRLPDGKMTGWIHDTLAPGDSLEVGGPAGDCFYAAGNSTQPNLLIGTGSGLAPLWGILHDAFANGHTGPIHLYHGSWRVAGLYLVEELRSLAARQKGFTYHPCVDAFDDGPLEGYQVGRADRVAFHDHPDLKGWRVYLCGHPDLVAAARKQAFLAGASMRDILADPFVLSKQPEPGISPAHNA